jgi:hypothetical protein
LHGVPKQAGNSYCYGRRQFNQFWHRAAKHDTKQANWYKRQMSEVKTV